MNDYWLTVLKQLSNHEADHTLGLLESMTVGEVFENLISFSDETGLIPYWKKGARAGEHRVTLRLGRETLHGVSVNFQEATYKVMLLAARTWLGFEENAAESGPTQLELPTS